MMAALPEWAEWIINHGLIGYNFKNPIIDGVFLFYPHPFFTLIFFIKISCVHKSCMFQTNTAALFSVVLIARYPLPSNQGILTTCTL